MPLGKYFLFGALSISCASLLIAAGGPSTRPAEGKTRSHKLTMPFSLLKSLTPAQTSQIEKLHADATEQIKKIEAKELDDQMALLTPEQVTELKLAEAKHKAELSEHRKGATTEPMN